MTSFRTGLGHDVHRLFPYHELVLGGVVVSREVGFERIRMVMCSRTRWSMHSPGRLDAFDATREHNTTDEADQG